MNDTPHLSTARWNAAQRHELQFWQHWRDLPPYRNLDVPRYWREMVAAFGLDWEVFADRRVLDVGCGPFGLIHYLDHAAERIRVDPLLGSYERRLPLNNRQLSLTAMAESLPLSDGSVGIVVCFNALDHMLDPVAALTEMARVLERGGRALLMIHTFPGWIGPLAAFDRLHPHHFTATAFEAMVRAHFEIEYCYTRKRSFAAPSFGDWLSRRGVATAAKYLAAELLVSSTFIRARLR